MDTNYIKNIKQIAFDAVESRAFHLIVAFILGIVAYSMYDKYHTDIAIQRQLRITDSLRIEIEHKNDLNDSLIARGVALDYEIENTKARVDTIYRSFTVYKRPPITEPDSATKFLKDFINE